MTTPGQTGCRICDLYARVEQAAPPGESFRCAECGKLFRRVTAGAINDGILNLLLRPAK